MIPKNSWQRNQLSNLCYFSICQFPISVPNRKLNVQTCNINSAFKNSRRTVKMTSVCFTQPTPFFGTPLNIF